ncbi:endophilin a [Culex quinquefasciatus]|uniref:Endophilin-A n=3 Tax=Culex pipiens complex TaxID=518105 RepID=B0X0K0_CULQU|nr:endophilin-A isoform X10 [Culex pipiens pallens]EDS38161.1 endophilin a [Culex quinquefasciatus]|eukprot:XP_001863172.1 endophilin a [Culex quinquefasciatus]
MAFAGLKKQINKANQYVTEKMGGAEGTKLDLDFMEMERKTDVTVELVEELQAKTKEYLQPNPTARAKMAAVKEGILADCMLTYGKKLGEDSIFANALVEMGDSLKQMADVKYSLDDNIKQNFLEPLHQLQTKDLKEVMHHRKKLQGRRLDFDCKKRRQAKDEEVRGAEEKFAESLQLAQVGMYNLLENDVEQVSQLVTFAEGLLDFHQQCADILRVLVEVLNEKREEAAARPKSEFVPKTLADLNIETLGSQDGMNGGTPFLSSRASPLPSPMRSPARTPMPAKPAQPCCTALYDFEPENPGELGFKENDVITLIQRVDENWFEGSVNGRTGYFPQSYVQVTVPFP